MVLERLKREDYLFHLITQISDAREQRLQLFWGAQDHSDFLQNSVVKLQAAYNTV